MLLQEKIKKTNFSGDRDRKYPTGDFSRYLPENDPVRKDLESLFSPYLHAPDAAISRIRAT